MSDLRREPEVVLLWRHPWSHALLRFILPPSQKQLIYDPNYGSPKEGPVRGLEGFSG